MHLIYRYFLLLIIFCIINADAQTPTFQKPLNVGEVPVYMIEIVFHTANVTVAGTDDKIKIRFNDNMKYFNLNKSNDEFERNQQDRFYISDRTIRFIRDFKYASIVKSGENGWAFDYFAIRINEVTMYESTISKRWLDNEAGFKTSFAFGASEIQNGFAISYKKPSCNVHTIMPIILQYQIKNMIETAVGDAIDSNYSAKNVIAHGLAWGNTSGINTIWGDATELKVRNPQTLSVDLDLQNIYELSNNTECDIDFDIYISCKDGIVNVEVLSNNLYDKDPFFNVPKFKTSINALLSRRFNVPNCTAHFESNGSLRYY